MDKTVMCTCVEDHECTGRGGYKWFKPTYEWVINLELSILAETDRDLSDLLYHEFEDTLRPDQVNRLGRQRAAVEEHCGRRARAATGRPWALARCKLAHQATANAIRDNKVETRRGKDDRADQPMM